ncbi:zinc transporter ZIP13 isoform X1 [Latimeria chalumnae]|uniref:zinc transporter ZIP13 isoform X1 n=1 Tax=Latimeria chalumnae TaxID=7897 RepID=UPI00313E59E7
MMRLKLLHCVLLFLSFCSLPGQLCEALSRRANTRKLSQRATVVHTMAGARWGCASDLQRYLSWDDLFAADQVETWLCSLVGSMLVGLSGIFPLLIIPIEAGAALKSKEGSQRLKQLLSFAIGGLLGDVFLHLLPEAWAYSSRLTAGGEQSHQLQKLLGLWVIGGIVAFLTLEKMFLGYDSEEEPVQEKQQLMVCSKPLSGIPNGMCSSEEFSLIKNRKTVAKVKTYSNGPTAQHKAQHRQQEKMKISGYLNLLANCIDNFTHGLAVAGSFLVSKKVGFLTTLAILLHEIPHEVGDFAILLRAGFDRWSAAKMQLLTALGGVLGACFAMCSQSSKGTGDTVVWILPFTSGGFLYIALVNVVPDLLQETHLRNSLQQVFLLFCGISVMVLLSVVVE